MLNKNTKNYNEYNQTSERVFNNEVNEIRSSKPKANNEGDDVYKQRGFELFQKFLKGQENENDPKDDPNFNIRELSNHPFNSFNNTLEDSKSPTINNEKQVDLKSNNNTQIYSKEDAKKTEENSIVMKTIPKIKENNNYASNNDFRHKANNSEETEQVELNRIVIINLREKEGKLLSKIKDLEIENNELKAKIKDLQEDVEERAQRYTLLSNEHENLKTQMNNLQNQSKALLNDNEYLRNEIFDKNQILLDCDKKELNAKISMEKLNTELNQMKEILAKKEENLEEQIQNQPKQLNIKIKYLKQGCDNNCNEISFNSKNQQLSSDQNIKNDTEEIIPKAHPQAQTNNPKDNIRVNKIIYCNINSTNGNFNNQNESLNKAQKKPYTNILAWNESPEQEKNYSKNQAKHYVKEQEKIQELSCEKPESEIKSNMNVVRVVQSLKQNERRTIGRAQNPTTTNGLKQNNKKKSGMQIILQGQREEPIMISDKIEDLESNLTSLQVERDNLKNELNKIENQKIKSIALIKKNQDLGSELNIIENNINMIKTKLRELNTLRQHY